MNEELKKDLETVVRAFLFVPIVEIKSKIRGALQFVLHKYNIQEEKFNIIVEQFGNKITIVLYLSIDGVRRCFECEVFGKSAGFEEIPLEAKV